MVQEVGLAEQASGAGQLGLAHGGKGGGALGVGGEWRVRGDRPGVEGWNYKQQPGTDASIERPMLAGAYFAGGVQRVSGTDPGSGWELLHAACAVQALALAGGAMGV